MVTILPPKVLAINHNENEANRYHRVCAILLETVNEEVRKVMRWMVM